MSLNHIIAKFLKISSEQAQVIMRLLALEGHCKEAKGIKTQVEFIQFLQGVGQAKWFKGHDRSQFPINIADQDIQKLYFDLFQRYGLFDECSYQGSSQERTPQFSIVLGSGEWMVKKEVSYLLKNLRAGIRPSENRVFGLSCNRELGSGSTQAENESKARLAALGMPLTEMEMVNLQVANALFEYNTENVYAFEPLGYQAINAQGGPHREEKKAITTGDTVVSLKTHIEGNTAYFNQLARPIRVAVYSAQPFIERQGRDIQRFLGDQYQVVTLGSGLTQAEFNAHPRSISICLGELARMINIAFTTQNLEIYQQPLNPDELNQLSSLASQLAFNHSTLFQYPHEGAETASSASSTYKKSL